MPSFSATCKAYAQHAILGASSRSSASVMTEPSGLTAGHSTRTIQFTDDLRAVEADLTQIIRCTVLAPGANFAGGQGGLRCNIVWWPATAGAIARRVGFLHNINWLRTPQKSSLTERTGWAGKGRIG